MMDIPKMLNLVRAAGQEGKGTGISARGGTPVPPSMGVAPLGELPLRPTKRSKWIRPSATPDQVRRMVEQLPLHVSTRIYLWQNPETVALGPCWLWAGHDSGAGRGGGYGRVSFEGKTTAVHILLYERLFGPIRGKRKQLDHECRVRNCCNPMHQEQVTQRMNINRMYRARRRAVLRLDVVCEPC